VTYQYDRRKKVPEAHVSDSIFRCGEAFVALPSNRRVPRKRVDVHAKEARDKREGQKDKGDPAQAPQARVELERDLAVSDGGRLVNLGERGSEVQV